MQAQLCACSTAHANCRICALELLINSWERESRSKEETDLPAAAAQSAARRETGCRGVLLLDICTGCFYLLILTGDTSLRGGSGEVSVEHHVVDVWVLSASHFKEPTSNLWRIPRHIQEEGRVLNPAQHSIRCGPAQFRRAWWGFVLSRLVEK